MHLKFFMYSFLLRWTVMGKSYDLYKLAVPHITFILCLKLKQFGMYILFETFFVILLALNLDGFH